MMDNRTYTTKQDDAIDDIVYRVYGSQLNGEVEAVLLSNPGLADYDFLLPAGVIIQLPALTISENKKLIQLFE